MLDETNYESLYHYFQQINLDKELPRFLYKNVALKAPEKFAFNATRIAALYYCIAFLAKAMLSPNCEKDLQTFFGEDDVGFIEVRDKYLSFAGVALRKFSKDLNRIPEIIRAKRITDDIEI